MPPNGMVLFAAEAKYWPSGQKAMLEGTGEKMAERHRSQNAAVRSFRDNNRTKDVFGSG